MLSSDDLLLGFSSILGKNTLIIDSMDGTEEISKPFLFTLTVHSLKKEIDCQSLLGTEATLSITLDNQERYFSGIIGSIQQMETREGSDGLLYVFYELQLRPKLWLLNFTQDYRIFQNQYALDIIINILQENGVTQIDNRVSNLGRQLRDFCVQYNESSFNFASRLMEEEGVAYCFNHTNGQHTLILMDQNNNGNSTYQKIPMSVSVINDKPSMNQINFLNRHYNVVPNTYKGLNYNYMTPSIPLRSSINGGGIGGTIHEYPASFNDLTTTEGVTSVRINELEWPKNIVSGKSTAPMLCEASTFTVYGHPSEDANITYFVCSLTHHLTRLPVHDAKIYENHSESRKHFMQNPRSSQVSQTLYDNTFSAIANSVTFSPPRVTKKPKIHSNQTALVVGPSGEEVYCDNLGRIKIQFYWDTRGTFDTNSSCWVRVAQNWAGSGWGGLVIPRVGMEVIVTFINGDPDMPLVVGCVYNANNTPPNSVTTNPNKSVFRTNSKHISGHYNEISVDDTNGAERVNINGAKDVDINVVGNYSLTLKNGAITTTLAQGNMNTTLDQGDKILTLTSGSYSIQLQQGSVTIQAVGDVSISSAGTLNLSGNNINMSAQNSVSISALNTIGLTGGALVTVDFPGKTPTFPM